MTCGCELVPHGLGRGGAGGGGGTGDGDVIQLISEYEDSSTASNDVVETLFSLDLSDYMTADGQVLRGRIVLDSTSAVGQGIDWTFALDGNSIGFLDQMVAGNDEFIIDYEITRTSVMTIRWSTIVHRLTGETYSDRMFLGDDFGLIFTDETLLTVTALANEAGDVGILRSITGQLGPV